MTREQYEAKINECHSGSECYQVCKEHIESLEAQLKAKDKEINRLNYLLHLGDEHGAKINLRIGNRYISKKFSETEISQIILLDQYLKDTFENMLKMLKDNA